MSSSGVIYAIIVGAWAVYLVPMWLRREDELNRARQTQRYAAAIKVLANKEAFERRWAQPGEAEEALPRAVGQDFAPAASAPTRVTTASSTSKPKSAPAPRSNPATRPVIAATGTAKATVTASIAEAPRGGTKPAPQRTANAAAAPKSPGPRTGLMARRRRVVGLLFTASTLGALVSADLGAQYLWAMATPAVLLSTYIVWLRRDEQVRAAARARRRAAAQEAREAREVREAADLQTRKEAEAVRLAAELAQAEADQQRRTQAARRRSAAARARAQVYTQEAPDLRRASNG
jgi:hypothetical protein